MSRRVLFWINALATNSTQMGCMMVHRHQFSGQPAESGTVRNLPALAERHDLVTAPAVAAAWPVGASQLAIAHDVVRRHNDVEVRSDWVASAR